MLEDGSVADASAFPSAQSGGEEAGWVPDATSIPITPLEFDIQARSFAHGFGRAVSQLTGREICVEVCAQSGVLHTRMSSPNRERQESDSEWTAPDLLLRWRGQVRPAVWHQARYFATADAATLEAMAALLEDVTKRMSRVTYLHHTLVLPARMALAQYCDHALTQGVATTDADALALVSGRGNATTNMAARLWGHRYAKHVPRLPQEGDGFGLAYPGWLESPDAPRQVTELYRACSDERSPAALLHRSAQHARQRLPEPTGTRHTSGDGRLTTLLRDRAYAALRITEGHAPLMHGRVTYELRRLMLRLGGRLKSQELIDDPEDLLYLPIAALRRDRGNALRDEVVRHKALCRHRETPSNMARAEDPLGDSEAARLIRRVLGQQPDSKAQGQSAGVAGSPGRALGRLRRVARQADIKRMRPGDVVLTPDSGAVWSYAAPTAAAFIAKTGSPFGHLASLARDYGIPCVVAAGDLAGICEGTMVEVDGNSGGVQPTGGGSS
jgi:phosphohistidine swiveling domain-containing protein